MKPPPKDFKEVNRLSFVVRAIETDCHAVPEGAFKLTSDHEIRRNKEFTGISKSELSNVNKYMHFRNVQSKVKKELMNKEDAIYRNDIFDGIADDEPKGVWSVQVNSVSMGAEIKCFMWPGYYAYHKEGLFGGIYIGNGIKNKDVGFML